MARPLRIEFPGAWYHVMNRGTGKRNIFSSNSHYQYFLSLLADTRERFNAEWHAYCLMGNHYHLLVRTPDGNLQRIMRHVNGLYTQYFNRSEDRDGPLFRGRYKAILVDSDAYWLMLSRYVHRNPLESGLVKNLSDYRWSSYPAHIGLVEPQSWLKTEYVLQAIGKRNRHKRYISYVTNQRDDVLIAHYNTSKVGSILGGDEFRKKVLAGRIPETDIPELKEMRALPGIENIVEVVCRRLDVDESEIWQSRRGKSVTNPARAIVMYLCQTVSDMRLAEIANAFGLKSYAGAGSVIRKLKIRIDQDKKLAKLVNLIILDLTP